jgi:hypothetical protein
VLVLGVRSRSSWHVRDVHGGQVFDVIVLPDHVMRLAMQALSTDSTQEADDSCSVLADWAEERGRTYDALVLRTPSLPDDPLRYRRVRVLRWLAGL